MLPQEPYKKFAVITLYAAVAMAVIYLVFNYLWGAVLPFVIAYILAECFRPVVRYSEKNKRFPKRFFVLFVVVLAAVAVAMLFYSLARQLVLEIIDLTGHITESLKLIRSDDAYAAEMIEKINGMIPFVDLRDRLWEMRGDLDRELWAMIVSFGETLSGSLISLAGTLVSFLPNVIFASVVVIISTYYFAVDRVKVNCFFLSLFPQWVRPLLKRTRDLLAETVGQYLRAYGILFFITFGELLLAFMIMRVEYSFVIALLIAILDILPVFGAGAVLIPWGIISTVAGDYGRGIGLLVTYAVITVIRQIVEPKIVGKFIGLSPLASLASMYIGLKLMGVAGIFLFPIAAIVLKRVLQLRQAANEN